MIPQIVKVCVQCAMSLCVMHCPKVHWAAYSVHCKRSPRAVCTVQCTVFRPATCTSPARGTAPTSVRWLLASSTTVLLAEQWQFPVLFYNHLPVLLWSHLPGIPLTLSWHLHHIFLAYLWHFPDISFPTSSWHLAVIYCCWLFQHMCLTSLKYLPEILWHLADIFLTSSWYLPDMIRWTSIHARSARSVASKSAARYSTV